jgi:hypothetical protein
MTRKEAEKNLLRQFSADAHSLITEYLNDTRSMYALMPTERSLFMDFIDWNHEQDKSGRFDASPEKTVSRTIDEITEEIRIERDFYTADVLRQKNLKDRKK